VLRLFLLCHELGLALSFGALICQLVLLGRFKAAPATAERVGSERSAAAIITRVQTPGVWLAVSSGVALAWVEEWAPLGQGWFHFKLLFVFWVVLATRLMMRNAAAFLSLRAECGETDSDRLRALKDNHAMIGYVTALSFLFVAIFSIWKPL
jgi:hypothetical protein